MRTMNSKTEVLKKMLASIPQFTKEQIESLSKAEDEAACKKCGRVIFCGANKLCEDTECGLKNGT